MSRFTADAIAAHLSPDSLWQLDVRACVDSTNTVLKAIAPTAPTGTVLIAERQTAGRGRMDRSFFSPPDCGLYMSMLLRPSLSAEESLLLTPAAAVAAAAAIESVCGVAVGIKWVNDLMVGGRKVGGILTESSLTGGGAAHVVVGIGINVYAPHEGFPAALDGIAASLLPAVEGEDLRPRLCAAVLNSFAGILGRLPGTDFLTEYRRRSMVLGKAVTLLPGGERVLVEDIDDACRLVVRDAKGMTRRVSSGECSIRLTEGRDA